MQWSAATSDALAALRTLILNGGWEPLLAAARGATTCCNFTQRLFALTKLIGEGAHEWAIVDTERFMARAGQAEPAAGIAVLWPALLLDRIQRITTSRR